jgi:F-type H+-transporting ATPase subunit alpha
MQQHHPELRDKLRQGKVSDETAARLKLHLDDFKAAFVARHTDAAAVVADQSDEDA